jgi:hypothetical protein
MTTEVVYCPTCARCYHSASPCLSLGCGHKLSRPNRIRVRTESAGGYEWVTIQRADNSFSFLVRPDGTVEFRRKIYGDWEWQERLANHHLLYPAAFRARRDIEIFRRIPEDLTGR